MWNLSKVGNNDKRTASLASSFCLWCQLWTYFTHCPGVFIVEVEQVNVDRVVSYLMIIDNFVVQLVVIWFILYTRLAVIVKLSWSITNQCSRLFNNNNNNSNNEKQQRKTKQKKQKNQANTNNVKHKTKYSEVYVEKYSLRSKKLYWIFP